MQRCNRGDIDHVVLCHPREASRLAPERGGLVDKTARLLLQLLQDYKCADVLLCRTCTRSVHVDTVWCVWKDFVFLARSLAVKLGTTSLSLPNVPVPYPT